MGLSMRRHSNPQRWALQPYKCSPNIYTQRSALQPYRNWELLISFVSKSLVINLWLTIADDGLLAEHMERWRGRTICRFCIVREKEERRLGFSSFHTFLCTSNDQYSLTFVNRFLVQIHGLELIWFQFWTRLGIGTETKFLIRFLLSN